MEAKRANGRKEERAGKARGADVCAAGMQSRADNLILWLEVKEEKVIVESGFSGAAQEDP